MSANEFVRQYIEGTAKLTEAYGYNPAEGSDSCGVGLVVALDGKRRRDVVLAGIDALKAGTSNDADLLGLADKIGTLEAGKLADVVAVPGDPSQNIRQTEHVFFVMKEGKIYKNEPAAK